MIPCLRKATCFALPSGAGAFWAAPPPPDVNSVAASSTGSRSVPVCITSSIWYPASSRMSSTYSRMAFGHADSGGRGVNEGGGCFSNSSTSQ